MNKIFKLFACSVVSLILVLAMSVTVFAANPSLESAITIDKNLKVTNPTLTSVDGPGLTYNYAVAPETPSANNGGTSISDGTNSGTVYAGVANGITFTTSSVSWPKGTAVTASATGADNIKSITATADASKFTKPGIYRYKVTETADPADPTTLGVTDENAAEVRYLDVYVENDTTGLKIAGIVMHDGSVEASHKKTFDASQFDTHNIEVKKAVAGNMADKTHQFPFSAAVSDNGRKYFEGKGSAATSATTENTTGTSTTTLANGESFWICGVSKAGTVTVTETNDTTDTYSTAVSGMGTVQATDVAPNGTIASGAITMTESGQALFTNTLEAVSPTGVITKVGPFILLVLIAGALIMFNRRVKVNKEQ